MTHTHTGLQPRIGPAGGATQPSGFGQIVSVLAGRFQRAFTLWNNRRAIYKLSRLDDHFLRDMGITRADIDWALAQPRHVDPSIALSDRLERRRNAARWARSFRAS